MKSSFAWVCCLFFTLTAFPVKSEKKLDKKKMDNFIRSALKAQRKKDGILSNSPGVAGLPVHPKGRSFLQIPKKPALEFLPELDSKELKIKCLFRYLVPNTNPEEVIEY